MLNANKSRWFETLFAVYNRNLLKRRFYSFQISGLEFFKSQKEEIPFIIYANHSSWWDGLAAFEISRKVGLDSFVMMEEKQLEKLFLFRKLGAFSVVREKPRKAVESINYAADLLNKNPKRALWIFPQGEILPNDARPLIFFNGITRIIEKIGKVYAVPIAMRFEFLGEFKPQIFIRIGQPEFVETKHISKTKELKNKFENCLTAVLDKLKSDIINKNLSDYTNLI